MNPSLRSRNVCLRAFTLVELLISVAIIAILVSLLLPTLGSARRSALSMNSASYLSSMGRGLRIFATEDSSGRLCSGAFDYIRDGDTKDVGWVGDLIELGIMQPGLALDPSRSTTTCRTVTEYTGMVTDAFDQVESGSYWASSEEALMSVTADLAEAKDMIASGYNTNYATSWSLVRGDPVDSSHSSQANVSATDGAMTPNDGRGPMTLDDLGVAVSQTFKIPIISEARSVETVNQSVNWLGETNSMERMFDRMGLETQFLSNSFTSGMNAYSGTGEHPGVDTNRTNGSEVTALKAWKQEFSDFWPNHFAKTIDELTLNDGTKLSLWHVNGYANILFADGHVGKIRDTNGINNEPDGFIGAYPESYLNGFTSFRANEEGNVWYGRVTNIPVLEQMFGSDSYGNSAQGSSDENR